MTPSRANAQRLQTASLQSLIHHAQGKKQGDLF